MINSLSTVLDFNKFEFFSRVANLFAYGRQFVENLTKIVIDRLLLERISLAGIARVAQVSERWLQTYVNEK